VNDDERHREPDQGPIRILVICTGNSARSILAEAAFRHLGGERVDVHSAGTHPKGVNPLSVRALEEAGIATAGLSSRPVTDYLARTFDYVITVCDDAREACPVFPGARESLHWSYPDPAAVEGTDEERLAAFSAVLADQLDRIRRFLPQAARKAATP
jgi:arsenate reductase